MSFTNIIILSVIIILPIIIAIISIAKEKAEDNKLWEEFGFNEPVDPRVVCTATVGETVIIVAEGPRSKAEPELVRFMRNNRCAANPRIRFARS